MEYSLKDLLRILNETDESDRVEAKLASEIGKSVLETICAFSNEPGMEGGYLVLGVKSKSPEEDLFPGNSPKYELVDIPSSDLDKLQNDLVTQAASVFNFPVRPFIKVEKEGGKIGIVVFVSELQAGQKPLYFKNRGLPSGAYRRIGGSDVKCTEDDLQIFYDHTETLDSSVMQGSGIEDLSEDSIRIYRKLRTDVNPSAEELSFETIDLLYALNGLKKDKNELKLTYTGLLVFGSRMALRRLMPMMRVDYIRLSTNTWIEEADSRFVSTLDMRSSLLEMVNRIINTINDDLPKGFELTDESIQAKSKGMPYRVLREAVVNALIHRSYRVHSPIQVIRYPNRIEIINPGFSLKSEDQLGEPGSVNRNPSIAAIFHDTNLAETKGSGIRTMRRLMDEVGMMPPTFESNRTKNTFTIRLLLHHLLSESDLGWLDYFKDYDLNDNQKRILIFVREVGAVDNSTFRQINGTDSTTSNTDLRKLREFKLLELKGKSRSAYYLPGLNLKKVLEADRKDKLSTNLEGLSTNLEGLSTNLEGLSTNLKNLLPEEIDELTKIFAEIEGLPKRVNDKRILERIILRLCSIYSFNLSELSKIIKKTEKHLSNEVIRPLLQRKDLIYKYPDMINHPDQSYITSKKVL